MPKLSQEMKDLLTEEMRKRILTAGEKILLRDGLDEFTMEKLAHEAGTAAGTIYNYFDNKETIIDAIMENSFQRLLQTTAGIAAKPQPAESMLRELAEFMLEDFKRVRRLHEAIMQRHPPISREKMRTGHRKLIDGVSQIIRQGRNNGEFNTDDMVLAASAFLGIIREMQFDPCGLFEHKTSRELADAAVAICRSGILGRGREK
ncbi:MAG: TetR/AcrR family transcriptional regulator [Victivallales bacterium]|nr:TetR/AcrR family transcriptional regulator [Victivallales bacterium]